MQDQTTQAETCYWPAESAAYYNLHCATCGHRLAQRGVSECFLVLSDIAKLN